MHILQSKHIRIKKDEFDNLLNNLNISTIQLPKIKINDTALPEGCNVGDIIKIEREDSSGKIEVYYRVIVV